MGWDGVRIRLRRLVLEIGCVGFTLEGGWRENGGWGIRE